MTDEEKYMTVIIQCAKSLDWDIGFQNGPDDQDVKGLIIGEPAYVEYILKHLDT